MTLAFAAVVIYAIIYAVRSSARKIVVDQITRDFQERSDVAEERFGFPKGSFATYPQKYFDSRLGFATQRGSGKYGLSMCVHSLLPHSRLYFFFDFESSSRIQALIYLIGANDARLMLKQTPESTMFAHEGVRYFDLPVAQACNFLMELEAIEVDGDRKAVNTIARGSVVKAMNEFYEYDQQTRDNFLSWRKAL